MNIQDLDVLRPESKIIHIGGKDIDVSFIPCGITFDVDKIVQELSSMSQEDLVSNGDVTKRAFELSIKLCALFCSRKHPELDEDWFNDNADVYQIKAFSAAITEALIKAYAGIDNSGGAPKKMKAPKKM